MFTVILLSTAAFTGFLGYRTYRISQIKKRAAILMQTLPDLPFQFFSGAAAPTSGYMVINYFSPDCSHCQYMATQLTSHKEAFKSTHVFMITPARIADAKLFAKTYGLENLDYVSVGTDPEFRFLKLFGGAMMPSFYVYGPDKKLLRKYLGETKIENLLPSKN